MKQNVYLYIDGVQADVETDGLILFTYAAEDADNPSVVVNSFSKTVTLPHTPVNDRIFDHIGLHTHAVRTGAFSPLVRTPFSIHAETGERLETGYLKLDAVTADGYNVTLYGGLGGLLYGLMYDAAGRVRTLADLDYYESIQVVDNDLTFPVNVDEVYNSWRYLCGLDSTPSRHAWRMIAFAPMYNGIPKDGFDAAKCVVSPSQVVGATFTGSALATFSQAVDEWRVRDLRSWMQRPVVSVQAVLDTIRQEVNDGDDYRLEWDAAFRNLFADVWLTLPMLAATVKQGGGGGRVTGGGNVTLGIGITTGRVDAYTPDADTLGHSYANNLTVSVSVSLTTNGSGTFAQDAYYHLATTDASVENVILLQLVAYDGTGVIGASTIVSLSRYAHTTADIITAMGSNLSSDFYAPDTLAGENYAVQWRATTNLSAQMYTQDATPQTFSVPFTLTAYNATRYRVIVQRYTLTGAAAMAGYVWRYSTDAQIRVSAIVRANVTDDWTEAAARTGMHVTKDVLLGQTMSPAAFLLSLVRTYGFRMHYDAAAKTMRILTRGNYYNGGVTDLTDRLDKGRGVQTVPYYFSHRFARWVLAGLGAFPEQYAADYGKPYAAMTVDTGFPFDNETENILDGVVLSTAADRLARDAAFFFVTQGAKTIPSPFLYGGSKILYPDGTEGDAPTVTGEATLTPVNSDWPGYDAYPRVSMEAKDGGSVNGHVLVRFGGRAAYTRYGYGTDYIRLTDDTPQMLALNKGVPCWRYGDADGRMYIVSDYTTLPSGRCPLPLFNRLTGAWSGGRWTLTGCLDMAYNEVIDIPAVAVGTVKGLYERLWESFVADRYDVDTRVATVRVLWRGVRVDASLLRRFYAFDGAMWALVRIKDYSMTTEEPTECTFVKVKDMTAYTSGQSL